MGGGISVRNYKFSYHYLAEDANKAIGHYMRKEKYAIKKYYKDLEFDNAAYEAFGKKYLELGDPYIRMPSIEKYLERIVIKVWDNMISVYLHGEMHIGYPGYYVPWTFSDIRRKGELFKYGSIDVVKYLEDNNDSISLYFSIRDKYEGDYYSRKAIVIERDGLTIQEIAPKELLEDLNQVELPEKTGDLKFDIPVFLPSNWETAWTKVKQTQFITVCN